VKLVERGTSTDHADGIRELTVADLDAAAGGKGNTSVKLHEACSSGKHIPKISIELW
jgi:hypothetical protein